MVTPTLSCALATSLASHEHARVAENLGYERAFFYDSPAVYTDVWISVCRAAELTDRIGLGPAVLIPSNRHPMTNAAAIATLVDLVGEERVVVAVGAGFTGRVAMGKRSLPWKGVAEYVRALQGLLNGETVNWEGAKIKMLHSADAAPSRPMRVRFLIAAGGPKGVAVAHELGDGALGSLRPVAGFDWSAVLLWGTVLREGDREHDARLIDAAGHGLAVVLHSAVETDDLDALLGAAEAQDYRASYGDVPATERHLAMYEGHCEFVNDRDMPFVTGPALLSAGLARSAAEWREKIARLVADGATEIVYQPAGSDIPGELASFADAASNA